MTIPDLIRKTKDSITVSAVKKAYSTINDAYTKAMEENGSPDDWNLVAWGDTTGALNLFAKISSYLKIYKNCGVSLDCSSGISYKTLDGADWSLLNGSGTAKAQLVDGTILYVFSFGSCSNVRGLSAPLQNVCGAYSVDINGIKGPNQLGKDLFEFYLTRDGIIPRGVAQDTTTPFDTTCASGNDGRGCTAWVIMNENLDYLKKGCTDLTWGGKTSCN